MKKLIRVFGLCIVLFFCLSLIAFFPASSFSQSSENDLSSFFEFERSVIAMNNYDTQSSPTAKTLSSENINSDSDTEDNGDDFSLKRLIVQGDVKNDFGATDVASYNNLHILCYSSESETQSAFEQLSKDKSLDVVIDQKQNLDEYCEQDFDYSQYVNWGAKAIDVGGYRQFLVDKNVQKEIVVVVMDTGINTSHSMFSNRLLKDTNGKIKGYSYFDSSYDYSYSNLAFDVDDASTKDIDEGDANKYSFEDDNGHGSHVAGIICDLTPSNVKILPIKVGDADGVSTTSIFISAYLRVLNIYSKQYTIACTNLSFSGAGKYGEADRDTFNAQCYEPLMEKNILSITSAGNEFEENNIENLKAVVVSALKKQNNGYTFDNSYSNYGKIIDIAAPGTHVLSAGISTSNSQNSSKWTYKSGTSMASPQVAAVVALLYLNPNLSQDFTASDIEQMLYDNCLDMGTPGKDEYYGNGILNIKYFEIDDTKETLSFIRDGSMVTEYVEYENFENAFNLEITCSSSEFEIFYSTDGLIPTINSTKYSSSILVDETIFIYAIGIKFENGQIVGRTNIFNISYFDASASIEDYFSVSSRGYLDNYTGNFSQLTIPKTMHGKTILGLESSLFKNSNLVSISLPDTLTTICGYAFQYCRKLKYIYAPSVTKLLIAAFSNCESLINVYDHHPLESECSGAFFPSLTETIGFTFNACKNLESVTLSKLEDVGSTKGCDFQSCSSLKSVDLPAITSIPTYTFFKCESLTGTFHIEKSVQSIEPMAFYGCKINSFTIDEKNDYLFTDGKGVYSKNSFVAFACGNEDVDYSILESVEIDRQSHDITTILGGVMACSKINELTIPSSISVIQGYAFDLSEINTLYYNAKNCSESGYWDKDIMALKLAFNSIGTIEIGANVEQVPERLFQSVFFDHLIINSHSTNFASCCFYRMPEQGVLDRLTFEFEDAIDEDYLSALSRTEIFTHNRVNYIYSRTEVPIELWSKLNHLKYHSKNGEYHVYSKEDLSSRFVIVSSSNEFGQISPKGDTYVSAGEDLTFTFLPNAGYRVSSIVVDGVNLLGEDLENAIKNGYTFSNISSDHTISVEFVCDVVGYTVKHWQQSLSTFGATCFGEKYYRLAKYDTSNTGQVGTETQAVASSYTGFVAQPITQQLIASDGGTTVDILYDRIEYDVNLVKGDGIDEVFGAGSYLFGQNVELSATILDGYTWNSWISSNSNIIQSSADINHKFTMPASAITFCATATKKQYTITIQSEGGGSISPSENKVVEHGANLELEFEADFGYKLTKLLIDKNDVTGFVVDNKYTMSNIVENHTVCATFDLVSYVITAKDATNGAISPSGTTSLKHGSNKKYTFTPNTGYHVASIIVDEAKLPEEMLQSAINNGYTFSNISSNHTIAVEFEINSYDIWAWTNGHGLISPSGKTSLEFGENKTFTFFPNTGYRIKDVKIDDASIGAASQYTFGNIDHSHTIFVEFEIQTFLVVIEIDGQGSVNSEGGQKVIEYDEDIIFNIFADDGWEIDKVFINDEEVEVLDNKFEICGANKDLEIYAVFKQKPAIFRLSSKTIAIIIGVAGVVFISLICLMIKKSRKRRLKSRF